MTMCWELLDLCNWIRIERGYWIDALNYVWYWYGLITWGLQPLEDFDLLE